MSLIHYDVLPVILLQMHPIAHSDFIRRDNDRISHLRLLQLLLRLLLSRRRGNARFPLARPARTRLHELLLPDIRTFLRVAIVHDNGHIRSEALELQHPIAKRRERRDDEERAPDAMGFQVRKESYRLECLAETHLVG